MAVEQETATFHCQYSSSGGINWRVNGTPLNKLDSANISITNGGTTITFPTLLVFHQTTVVCVAFFDTSPPQFTSPVMLLVQGLSPACMVAIQLLIQFRMCNCADLPQTLQAQ